MYLLYKLFYYVMLYDKNGPVSKLGSIIPTLSATLHLSFSYDLKDSNHMPLVEILRTFQYTRRLFEQIDFSFRIFVPVNEQRQAGKERRYLNNIVEKRHEWLFNN